MKYKVINQFKHSLEGVLNDAAKDGWTVTGSPVIGTDGWVTVIMEKEVPVERIGPVLPN